MTTPVWIGLGSNLGDRKAILDAAVAALADAPGLAVEAVSPYLETSPVGGPPGQGAFLNAAARLATTLGPRELLALTREIEDRLGRRRTVRWGERTLDIDLLIYGCKFLDTPDLKLPHPRLAFRRFVLAPLAQIAPGIVDPMTRRTIADLLANLDRKPRLLALDGPRGKTKATVFRLLIESLPAFGVEESDDPGDPFERIGRKAEALHPGRWAAETLRAPWIVADYCLPLDLLRASTTSDWGGRLGSPESGGMPAYHMGLRRARVAAGKALAPTILAALPADHEIRRRPGLLQTPLLRIESDEPDAIVAEVLATCRGIAGT